MGTRLLHIIATPRGLASNTGRVSSVLIEELHQRYDDLEVTTLELRNAAAKAAIADVRSWVPAGAWQAEPAGALTP